MKKELMFCLVFVLVVGGVVSTISTDSVKLEKSSDKLNIGEDFCVFTGTVDDDDFSSLKDGSVGTYDYEQKITFGCGIELQSFSDSDYKSGEQTTGFHISSNDFILNYTLDFLMDIPFDSTLDNRQIYLLGKSYVIIQVDSDDEEIILQDGEGNILVLDSGRDVELNQNIYEGLTVYLPKVSSNGKLDKIVIEWRVDEESFITEEMNLKLPLLESLEFRFEGLSEVSGETFGNLYLDSFYEGEVLVESTNDKISCLDSDGGVDYFSKGNVNLSKPTSSSYTSFADLCLSEWMGGGLFGELFINLSIQEGVLTESQKSNTNILIEGKCISPIPSDAYLDTRYSTIDNLFYFMKAYECPKGCSNGVCIGEGSSDEVNETEQTQQQTTTQDQEQTQNQQGVTNTASKPDVLEKIPDKGVFMLNGKEMKVSRNENGEISIDFGEGDVVDVGSSLDVIKNKLGAYIMTSMGGNQKIEITAKDAIIKSTKIDEVDKVEIEEYKTIAVYSVYGTKDARLFFVIPKKAQVVQKISVDEGRLLDTEKPWWSFLAFGI
ncbi:MAG: hypothetical protein ABIA78_00300 [archaeon]